VGAHDSRGRPEIPAARPASTAFLSLVEAVPAEFTGQRAVNR